MDKKKLALISVATLLSFGVTGFVSADETVSEPDQSQQVSTNQKEYDTSNIVSVFYDGSDTYVTLTNGEFLILKDYEGKLGEFEITSQTVISRLRGVPTSKYLTKTWAGYGTCPSSMFAWGMFSYNDSAHGGWVQAIFEGNVPRLTASQGTAGGQYATYGGYVPRVSLSPA